MIAVEKIPQVHVKVAAAMMGFTPETLQLGLRQGLFPWGVAIRTGTDRWRYWINRARFCEHEHVSEEDVQRYEDELAAEVSA